MLTRRELSIAAAAALTTFAAVAWAQSPAKPVIKSAVVDVNKIEAQTANYGSKRQLLDGRTAMLDMLECHISSVNPGEATHPPRPQADEELVIVKEGTLEAQIDGQPQRVGPGSIIFAAGGDPHGVKNISETPAVYYVIRWTTSGAIKSAN